MTLFWHNKGISEETRLKLRALAPAGWIPPEDDFAPKTLKVNIKPEEVEREMRKKPRGRIRA